MASAIKRCAVCREVKLRSDFHRNPDNADRLQSTCKACCVEPAMRRRHGLSRAEKTLLAIQQGGCRICRTDDPGQRGWAVDHDHRCCGPIKSCDECRRGILCGRCNTALGMARDNPALLRAMADYLESDERLILGTPKGWSLMLLDLEQAASNP